MARWTSIADAIAARLKTLPQYVKSVDAKVPTEQLGPQGLLFDEPENVRQNFEQIKWFTPLVKPWAQDTGNGRTTFERFLKTLDTMTRIEAAANVLRRHPSEPESTGFIDLLARSWNETIEHPEAPLKVGSTLPDLASLDASVIGRSMLPIIGRPLASLLKVQWQVFECTQWVGFDGEMVMAPAPNQVVRQLALSQQGVGRDIFALQIDRL